MRLANWFCTDSFVSYSTLEFTPVGQPLPDYVTVVGTVTEVGPGVVRVRWDDAPPGMPASLPTAALEADRLLVVAGDGELVWADNTGLNTPGDGTLIVGRGWNAHRWDPTDRVRVSWHELAGADTLSLAAEVTRWSKPAAAVGNETPIPELPAGIGSSTKPSDVSAATHDSLLTYPPPTALLSWAHRDENWSNDEAEAWEGSVIALATLLREVGIDVDLDLLHDAEPDIDWTRWGPAAIEMADYVFVVISKGWRQRWDGTNSPTMGAGAATEADSLHGIFESNQHDFQRRTKVILLPGVSPDEIPANLRRLVRFWIDPCDRFSTDGLIRHVTGQPTYQLPPVGPLRRLDSSPAPEGSSTSNLVARFEELSASRENPATDGPSDSDGMERASIEQTLTLRGLAVGDHHPAIEPSAYDSNMGMDRAAGDSLLRRVQLEHPDKIWGAGRCVRCARPIPVEVGSNDEWVCSKLCHDRWYRMLYSVIDPDSQEEVMTKTPRVPPYWI